MARTAQFERSEVLEKAMHAFWEQGYRATSLSKLVDVTDLKPGSIYAAFNSKEELFLAVLDHYTARSLSRIDKALAQASSPLEGIREYLKSFTQSVMDPQANRGCLLVNTALELARQNQSIQDQVSEHLQAIEVRFLQALEAAKSSGELAADKNPQELATFIMTNIWGLRVLGSTSTKAERSAHVVKQVLKALD